MPPNENNYQPVAVAVSDNSRIVVVGSPKSRDGQGAIFVYKDEQFISTYSSPSGLSAYNPGDALG